MGYEWIASGNGFEEEVDQNQEALWPQSDLKLIDDTFSYDSRLLMGQDIFSDSSPLVVFKNRSFITDTCKYNSKTDEVTSFSGEVVSEDYIAAVKKIIHCKFDISVNILEYDYYSYIKKYIDAQS